MSFNKRTFLLEGKTCNNISQRLPARLISRNWSSQERRETKTNENATTKQHQGQLSGQHSGQDQQKIAQLRKAFAQCQGREAEPEGSELSRQG